MRVMNDRWRVLLVLCLSLIAVGVAYVNSLPNDFIRDDHFLIEVNPAIRSIKPLQYLTSPFWGDKSQLGIYRPFVLFTFAVEYPFWKTWPAGYRGINLLLHAINGVLVFLLARGLVSSPAAAYATAALYVLHPAHTEAVAGVAGRSELLGATFFFTAWLLFRSRRNVLSAVVFLLALFSKETPIMFPAVMALEMWIAEGSFKKILLEWKRFVAPVGVAATYLVLRAHALGTLAMPKSAQYLNGQWTVGQRVLTSGRVFLTYFKLLFVPVRISGDYDFNSIPVATWSAWDAWLGLFVVLATIVIALCIARKAPAVAFAIMFFYVALFPVSNWILPAGATMAERYLYVPSFGFALLAGMAWSRIQSAERRAITAAGVLMIAILLCISHNFMWRGNLSYYENVVNVYPNNVAGRLGYGVALLEAGHADEAVQQLEAGLRVAKNPALLTALAGAKIGIEHSCKNARPLLDEALATSNEYFARWTLAQCLERDGDVVNAESTYRRAIADAQFPDPKIFVDLGRLLDKTGRHSEALETYRLAGR
jgi:tetratricopeptide (TPR) repeat protein